MITEVLHRHILKGNPTVFILALDLMLYILLKQEIILIMDSPVGLESNSKNDNFNLVNVLQLSRHISLFILET